ncbi:MAG: sialidase family protein [Candidatus Korobacteraceae bacterium]
MKPLYSLPCPGVRRAVFVCAIALALGVLVTIPAIAQIMPRQLSQDSFTNESSQHMTEVEPGAFSHGHIIVTGFQVARISGGGGADIGFATFADSSAAGDWTNGYLPGLTIYQGGGTNTAASDASVAYDAKHGEWLISTLPIGSTDLVAVSRSSDAIHWDNPIYVITSGDADKNWLACDNTPTSPYYGNCYQEWDSPAQGDYLQMSTSSDGGVTWGPAKGTAGNDYGIGGQALTLPNGTVVVSYADFNGGMSAFTSTNGGQSWNAAVSIATAPSHAEAGGLRSLSLPSAAIDGAGTIYVSWPDCRFRSGCASNDIVYSTTTDGIHWSSVVRVPIDPVTSTVDHFIQGLAIDTNTSGSTAHIGLTYYYYPVSNCSASTCSLLAGFIQSANGGATWTYPLQLGTAMQLSWLPNTYSGRMVADYVATAYVDGKAFPIWAQAYPLTGSTYHEAIFTTFLGNTPAEGQLSSANDKPIPNAKSDHGPRQFYDQDNQVPVHPGKISSPDKH